MYATSYLVSETLTQLITIGGVELTNSRRYVDMTENDAVRWQYQASSGIAVMIDYSLDDGATWATLATEYGVIGTAPVVTTWIVIPDEAKTADVLLRAFATGTGILTTVNFVELDYR